MKVRTLSGPERKEFGAALRARRRTSKISLRRAARLAHLSPTYLSKIERGEFPPPATATIVRLAGVLSIDAWWLVREAGHLPDELCQRLLLAPVGVQQAIDSLLATCRSQIQNSLN